MNWVLTPDGIKECLAELKDDGEDYILKHVTYQPQEPLNTVPKPKDPALFGLLYDSFTVYKHAVTARAIPPQIMHRSHK